MQEVQIVQNQDGSVSVIIIFHDKEKATAFINKELKEAGNEIGLKKSHDFYALTIKDYFIKLTKENALPGQFELLENEPKYLQVGYHDSRDSFITLPSYKASVY